jgi:hypothetical protein
MGAYELRFEISSFVKNIKISSLKAPIWGFEGRILSLLFSSDNFELWLQLCGL